MAKFLSDEWNAAVAEALNSSDTFTNAAKGVQLTLQFEIANPPQGDGKYWARISDGTYTQESGSVDGADVTIQYDYDTAVAIMKGELNQQAAFMQGKLKLGPGSNMGKLMQNLGLIQAMGPIFKNIDTDY